MVVGVLFIIIIIIIRNICSAPFTAVFILGISGGKFPPPQNLKFPPPQKKILTEYNNSNIKSVKYGKIINIVAFICVS